MAAVPKSGSTVLTSTESSFHEWRDGRNRHRSGLRCLRERVCRNYGSGNDANGCSKLMDFHEAAFRWLGFEAYSVLRIETGY
jgi:hypothetical protein